MRSIIQILKVDELKKGIGAKTGRPEEMQALLDIKRIHRASSAPKEY
ncbi:MAG TPA: hypothetical protein VIN03_26035 [Roseateles sp.]